MGEVREMRGGKTGSGLVRKGPIRPGYKEHGLDTLSGGEAR